MNKILLLLTNNIESAPFLHSQLLDVYKDVTFYDKKIVFCGGTDKEKIGAYITKRNYTSSTSVFKYLKYYFNLFKELWINRKSSQTIHLRGFVSAFLFYFIPKFFIKEYKYIYDPRGAFLIEQSEVNNKALNVFLKKIEKKIISKSITTIVTTNNFKNLFTDHYGYDKKYLVCYNSSSFNNVSNAIDIEKLELVNICYCGSVNHWHNLDEIARLTKYIYDILEKKAKIFFFTSPKNKDEIIKKLHPIPETDIQVRFVPYKDLEEELNKMHICLSVVMPTISTRIASPIKVSDYIMLNKHIVMNEEIGDFDDFYLKNNSALLYKYGKELNFKKHDIINLNLDKNKELIPKLRVKTNTNNIIKVLNIN